MKYTFDKVCEILLMP